MSEMERTALGEVLDFREGPGIMAVDFRDHGVPLIRLAGLKAGADILDGCNYLDPEKVEVRWSQFRLDSGDVLLSTSASLGEVAVVDDQGVGSVPYTGIIRFRPADDRIDPAFIPWIFRASDFKQQIEAMGVGSVMRHFGPSHLRSMTVSYPARNEQRAIAEVLGALDGKIAANAKLAATTDEYLAARFVEFAAGDHGLEPVALSDIAAVNGAVAKPVSGRQLRYVDIASVGVGEFNFPELSDWDSAPSRARRRIRRGDTIWSTVRPNRRSHALNLSDDPDLVGSTGLAVLTPTHVGFAYLYELTKTDEFVSHLENSAEGSAYPAVRADRFEVALVPLLGQSRREKFEAVAAPMRVRQHMAAMESDVLAKLRDTLLPPLMSGKLRVRDAEKQVEGAV